MSTSKFGHNSRPGVEPCRDASGHSSAIVSARHQVHLRKRINEAGISMLKELEGLRLEPYYDVAGYPTIGYGHKLSNEMWAGLKEFQPITANKAAKFLLMDVDCAKRDVDSDVEVDLSNNEYAALVSFTYNIGHGAFSDSTLLKMLNAGDGRVERGDAPGRHGPCSFAPSTPLLSFFGCPSRCGPCSDRSKPWLSALRRALISPLIGEFHLSASVLPGPFSLGARGSP
jgi:GH24 family phage-related lysozyme (muramidase)